MRQYDEASRSRTLHAFNILDTPREPAFDELAQIASDVCGTPIAVVNLVDTKRQFFKAEVGLGVRETPLETSFCGQAILSEDFMLVPDAALDPRFSCNPLVTGEPGLRFYAGALLKTPDGVPIGTVCVLDYKPRDLNEHQIRTLRLLASQAMTQLQLRRALADQIRTANRQRLIAELSDRFREITDIGEIAQGAAVLMGEALGARRAGFGVVDLASETVEMQPNWCAEGVAPVEGTYRFRDYGSFLDDLKVGELVAIQDVELDERTRNFSEALKGIGIRALFNVPVLEQGKLNLVLFAHYPEPFFWSDEDIAFARQLADRTHAAVAKAKAELQQEVLNQELSHRLKNTLAMVQAIAMQTLRSVTERDAVEALNNRIHALAQAHNVLLQRSWSAAPMKEIVEAVVAPFNTEARCHVSGPTVRLGARAALSLSLLLHELATNAVKYGSLSSPEGSVEVSWTIIQDSDEPELVLGWIEKDGPEVSPPKRTGFGSRLIKLGLIGTGGVELHYSKAGLRAEMRAPLSQIQKS
ncbi:GAF domain-containing protein [Tianweitania sediminis]|uniref:histidine kinase n=1 Tax=Tianweitania sediminis TaxID=1502156 RepID=A0A8J7RES4_9HYPH|nr:GAF domain-containing protein [Tianweitania sediminis]MBP0437156.1 GAF domain-containing protein [Tianweitania sediminis]